MDLVSYFSEITEELKRKSGKIREGFATHALSAGENREDLVRDFLRDYLPKTYGVETGLIINNQGEFSNQADLVIVDQLNNAPLFPSSTNKIWLAESVYALIEVKTQLTPTTIKDSIEKCVKFKRLNRTFAALPSLPRITDSLFILWSFDGPSPDTVKKNVLEAVKDLDIEDQPDFIIVPNKILVSGGTYRRLAKFGLPGSPYQNGILQNNPGKTYLELFDPFEFMVFNENTLLAWLVWLTSWLKGAGQRSAPLDMYLQRGGILGHII